MNEFLQKSATNCSSWNKRQLIIDTKEKEIFMISSTKYLMFVSELFLHPIVIEFTHGKKFFCFFGVGG
jgi:hypothetical protein